MHTRWHAHEQKHSVGGVGMGLSAPPNLLVLPAPQPMATEAAAQVHSPSPGSSEAGEPSSRARALYSSASQQEDANVQLSSSSLAARLLSPTMSLYPDHSRQSSSKSLASAVGEGEGAWMGEGGRREGVHGMFDGGDTLKASAGEGGVGEGGQVECAGTRATASPVVLPNPSRGRK